MSRGRIWTPDEREFIEELADAGHSISAVSDLLRQAGVAASTGAVAGFASRNGITFHGRQPSWTARRRARHRAAMQQFWRTRRQGSA